MGKYIRSFGEMTKGDFQTAGGKAANLGELTLNGFNVPDGFCVTSDSLAYLVEENKLQEKIDSIILYSTKLVSPEILFKDGSFEKTE